MKQIIIVILTTFFLTSCATILLRKDYKVNITSDLQNAKIEIKDSIYNLPTTFRINRSKEDLEINLISDSLNKKYTVKASPNGMFLYGNLICYPILPIMYGIDFTNRKRFYYGKTIFLNSKDTAKIIRPKILKKYYDYWHKNYETNKGQINFTLSLPWINSFYLQPYQETSKSNIGFWGISSGLEYYYKKNKYISLSGIAVTDFFLPFPAAVEFSGEREAMYSIYISLTNNYKLRRFTLGYGINFSNNIWELKYYDSFDPPAKTREPTTKSDNSIGITLNGYHQISKVFYIGLIYRPTLLKIYPNIDFKYEHLISIDFLWKIRIKK